MVTDEKKFLTVVFYGGPDVGISSLIRRTPFDYEAEYTWGLGIEFYTQAVRVGNKDHDLLMFELGFDRGLDTIKKGLKKGNAGIVLVFDVTRRETFQDAKRFFNEHRKEFRNLPWIFIANKVDLVDERMVGRNEIKKVSKELSVPFLETSVLERETIEKTFHVIAEIILKSS
jgi:GTPase SAR1 family protein